MQGNDTQQDNYDQFWERIPQEFRFLFFRMPVLRSDAAFYRGFTIRLANTIGPQDLREWLLVKDIVDHTCYILFLRRVEMNMIDLATREALIVILTALSHGELADNVKQLAKGWFCGLETKKSVVKLFHDYGLSPVHIWISIAKASGLTRNSRAYLDRKDCALFRQVNCRIPNTNRRRTER